MFILTKEIGKGKERICFQHPNEGDKVVKVVYISSDKQMKRELSIYHMLANKKGISYEHIPKYYGEIETNKGTGYTFDKIMNDNDSLPKTLHWHLQNGKKLDEFSAELKELKSYLLKHAIIFCNDMSYEGNILVKENSDGTLKLVVIDGLGDVVLIQWLNSIGFLVKKKIHRRWKRLIQRLKKFEMESV